MSPPGPRSRRPVVSVLLPVRDALPYLGECLESLDAQTLRAREPGAQEIVAVDDGSTDGSESLLRRRAAADPSFRLVRTRRRGLVAALNAGLAACRGDLVARMDADDRCHPRRLELQLRALREDPRLDVVSCRVAHFPRAAVGEGFRVYERWLNRLVEHEQILRERFIESPLPHPSVLLRRRALAEAGGYRDRGWPEDYDLWLRLAARGARFGKVRRTLLYWRQHERRLTRTDPRYAVERFLECKAHHLARGPLRGVPSVLVWGAGQTGRRLSKHLLRRDVPIAAFIDVDPAKIGRTLRGRPIHGPAELARLLESRPGAVVLAAVSSRGARGLIRRRLGRAGLREGADYWCVA